MKKYIAWVWALLLIGGTPSNLIGAPTDDYKAVPPFIIENSARVNVLIILDNSNSMDMDVNAVAAPPVAPRSPAMPSNRSSTVMGPC